MDKFSIAMVNICLNSPCGTNEAIKEFEQRSSLDVMENHKPQHFEPQNQNVGV